VYRFWDARELAQKDARELAQKDARELAQKKAVNRAEAQGFQARFTDIFGRQASL
jgi:hypothetical protein